MYIEQLAFWHFGILAFWHFGILFGIRTTGPVLTLFRGAFPLPFSVFLICLSGFPCLFCCSDGETVERRRQRRVQDQRPPQRALVLFCRSGAQLRLPERAVLEPQFGQPQTPFLRTRSAGRGGMCPDCSEVEKGQATAEAGAGGSQSSKSR